VSDRTYQTAIVYACPEALRQKVLEILSQYECRDDDDKTVLHLGVEYWMNGGVGVSSETARALCDLSDWIVAVTYGDHDGKFHGERFTVLDGRISSLYCDADDEDYVWVSDLSRILNQNDLNTAERIAKIEDLIELPRLNRVASEARRYRTSSVVIVYACPEALQKEAMKILSRYESCYSDRTVLHLGAEYWMNGVVGVSSETARALCDLGGGVVAVTYEGDVAARQTLSELYRTWCRLGGTDAEDAKEEAKLYRDILASEIKYGESPLLHFTVLGGAVVSSSVAAGGDAGPFLDGLATLFRASGEGGSNGLDGVAGLVKLGSVDS